jgi:hypothetical protein
LLGFFSSFLENHNPERNHPDHSSSTFKTLAASFSFLLSLSRSALGLPVFLLSTFQFFDFSIFPLFNACPAFQSVFSGLAVDSFFFIIFFSTTFGIQQKK